LHTIVLPFRSTCCCDGGKLGIHKFLFISYEIRTTFIVIQLLACERADFFPCYPLYLISLVYKCTFAACAHLKEGVEVLQIDGSR
jgi:hypothetical protein